MVNFLNPAAFRIIDIRTIDALLCNIFRGNTSKTEYGRFRPSEIFLSSHTITYINLHFHDSV